MRQEAALSAGGPQTSATGVLSRRIRESRERRNLRASIRALEKEEQVRLAEIERLLRRQRRLIRQINSLQTVRQMMGLWHTLHIPLGLTLFAAMFIHIFATIYYGGL